MGVSLILKLHAQALSLFVLVCNFCGQLSLIKSGVSSNCLFIVIESLSFCDFCDLLLLLNYISPIEIIFFHALLRICIG